MITENMNWYTLDTLTHGATDAKSINSVKVLKDYFKVESNKIFGASSEDVVDFGRIKDDETYRVLNMLGDGLQEIEYKDQRFIIENNEGMTQIFTDSPITLPVYI